MLYFTKFAFFVWRISERDVPHADGFLPVHLDLERTMLKPYPDRAIEARPRNWLVPVILVTLREESSYGYELIELLKEFGFEEMNSGTLYRSLRQMENEGLCKSEWETSRGGPARRMYSITVAGEAHLASWAEGCRRYQQVVDAFFQAYIGFAPHASEDNASEDGQAA